MTGLMQQKLSLTGQMFYWHEHFSPDKPKLISKVYLKPYSVGGISGKGKDKKPYTKSGLFCPRCNVIKN